MAVLMGFPQATANAVAAAIVARFAGSATNKLNIVNAAGAIIAQATDVGVSATANGVSFSSAGGAAISSTDVAAGFDLTDASDNVVLTFRNTTITVTPANQENGTDLFTSTGHGLQNGQLLVVSGGIPTTTPAISNGDAVFVVNATANTFQIERSPGAGPVDITSAAGSDTDFSLPAAVGATGSGAILEITGGTSLTSGNTITISSGSLEIPLDNVVSGQ